MARPMQTNFEKPKDMKKAIKNLVSYVKPFLPIIIIAVVLAIASCVLSIIGPNFLKDITNTITAYVTEFMKAFSMGQDTSGITLDLQKIANIGILLVSFYLVSYLLGYFQNTILASTSHKVSYKLRKQISYKINKMPLKYLDRNSYGDVLSRVTNDVDTISQSLGNSIGTLVTSITMIFGTLIAMFVTNWILAFVAVISVLLGFVLMATIVKKSQKYFITGQKMLGQINGHIEEMYSGYNVIKVYNASLESKHKFNKLNNDLYTSAWKSQFLSGLMGPLMGFIGNFGYVAVCIVGAILVANGISSLGVISAFIIYVRLFSNPLSQLAQVATNFQSAGAASERVFSLLEENELEDESHKTEILNPKDVNGSVEFKNVKFGYDKEKTIIKNFTASIKAGQKVAIVGPTGAGKTTLVNLLMRFYEIDDGEILIDNKNIKDLTRENIHDLFGMVLQDTWLYQDTVKNNLIYNKQGLTDEQIKEACKACGIHHFIKTLPNGYNTILDDNTSVSNGQKQLLTIARAMLQNSPMLILDEATSSVDTRIEHLIQKAMDNLTQNRTSFIIAHRLSTIKNADLILVLKDGDIIEQGSHNELLAKNGFYAELYNSQFEDKE